MFFKSKPLKRTCRALSTFFLILHWLENERDDTVCRSYYVDHSCGCTQKQNKTPWFSEVLSWKGGARDLHSLIGCVSESRTARDLKENVTSENHTHGDIVAFLGLIY